MILKKFSAAIATAALLGNIFTPVAFADTNITISGNGTDSYNKAKVSDSNTTVVEQSNVSTVGTEVYSSANTGGNTASGNTGGDVTIDTGDAKNKTTVDVTTGGNVAAVSSCCGCKGNTTININDNGSRSTNKTKVESYKTTFVGQSNYSDVWTKVKNKKANTGWNQSSDNTNGTVGITTGNAKNKTRVTVVTGDNTAIISGCCCDQVL